MALRREVIRSTPNEPIERPLYGARLYLDDLEHIVDDLRRFMADDSRQTELTIKAGESVAETVDDLRDASRRELRDVTISVPYLHMWANFRRDGSKVKAWGPLEFETTPGMTAIVKNMVDSIASFVHQPDRRSWRFYVMPTAWPAVAILAGAFLTLLGMLGGVLAGTRPLRSLVISTGVVVVAIPIVTGYIARHMGGRVTVVALRRHEARQRSRDTRRFYVLAFTGIIGAAFGVAGTLVVQVVFGLCP